MKLVDGAALEMAAMQHDAYPSLRMEYVEFSGVQVQQRKWQSARGLEH
jgi:hypothetical protein